MILLHVCKRVYVCNNISLNNKFAQKIDNTFLQLIVTGKGNSIIACHKGVFCNNISLNTPAIIFL